MPSTLTSTLLTALALVPFIQVQVYASVLPRSNDNDGKPTSLQRGSDPAFTIPQIQLDSVLSCVGGIESIGSGTKKPFLLVPGTWANATMAYDPGWRDFLMSEEGGSFTPCYVSPPPYMTADIQDTLEYIVNAIHRISDATLTSGQKRPFPIIGHSQGGLAIQSALTYYPSIRKEVSQFISLAGSVHGTINVPVIPEAALYTTVLDPAVWQQGYASNWVLTMKKKGGWYNWVPTTSLFSLSDATVRPQLNASSLSGSATFIAGRHAGNILVQDACPNLPIMHNEFLVADFAYKVVKLAVVEAGNGKKFVSAQEVQEAVKSGKIDCGVYYAPNADLALYNQTLALVNGFAAGSPRVIAQVHAEPLLRPFVYATKNNEVHDL